MLHDQSDSFNLHYADEDLGTEFLKYNFTTKRGILLLVVDCHLTPQVALYLKKVTLDNIISILKDSLSNEYNGLSSLALCRFGTARCTI